jgi:hypothetical protein
LKVIVHFFSFLTFSNFIFGFNLFFRFLGCNLSSSSFFICFYCSNFCLSLLLFSQFFFFSCSHSISLLLLINRVWFGANHFGIDSNRIVILLSMLLPQRSLVNLNKTIWVRLSWFLFFNFFFRLLLVIQISLELQ